MLAPLLCAIACLAPQDPPANVTVEVTGLVVDAQLRPLSGIAVNHLAADDARIDAALGSATQRTATDGRFRLEITLPQGSKQHLVLGGGRWATMTCPLPTRKDGALDLGAVAMAPGSTMAGRVRDAEGRPIAGALVVASDLLDSQQFLGNRGSGNSLMCRTRATSDARGIVRLPGMVQSVGSVRVSCEGHYDEVLQPVAVGTPIDVALSPAPRWRGRVVAPDGGPAGDVSLHLGNDKVGITAADGTFVVSPRERGITKLRAFARRDDRALSATCELVDPETTLELRLAASTPEEKSRVRVHARSATGAPVAKFDAMVAWSPANQLQYRCDAMLMARLSGRDEGWRGATTDGEAVVEGPPRQPRDDTGLVFVIAEGHGMGRLQIGPDAIGGAPVVVTLPEEAVLRGQVRSATSGDPIAGAAVIFTQRITDNERRHYGIGFRTVESLLGTPTSTRTDAQGRYELRGLPPGKGDLFLHVPGRIDLEPKTLELVAGETRKDVDFALPENVALRGKLLGTAPPGSQVRVHWHRPNMSSSAWASEFDGAVPLAGDGSFVVPDLHPKDYEVQLLVAAPPRGGQRLKLAAGIWHGSQSDAEPLTFQSPAPAQVVGKVGGPVPWQRLAVAAVWQERENNYYGEFRIAGPMAMLDAERRFRVFVPPRKAHLLLFDAVTGVPLEWLAIDEGAPTQEVTLEGAAVRVEVSLRAWDSGSERAACVVDHVPENENWPFGVGEFVPQNFGGNQKGGIRATFRVGDRIDYWLRARSGQLRVHGDNVPLQELDLSAASGVLEVSVGKPK